MDENIKVFISNITRGQKPLKNNLHDLKTVVAAIPSTQDRQRKHHTCEFQPKSDKYYIPKTRNKLKVRTVRDIRNVFEKEVYSNLPDDLDRQHHAIFNKITCGISKSDETKILAKNVLKSENAISRSSWQMLMNLNPEDQANSVQYVLWNGKCIRVNGSKGGKSKFLCNFDLARKNACVRKRNILRKKTQTKRKMLLHNSLRVQFKPGPLSKKKILDDSYQRYNVGSSELVKLPKLGLDIQPTYGLVLKPFISNFLQNLCQQDGTISEKWADFSVSVLGSRKNCEVVQNDPKSCVTFDLNYKSNQRRIIMRRDIDIKLNENNVQDNLLPVIDCTEDESSILPEIETIMEKMLDCVEVSVNQDKMYSGVDELRGISSEHFSNCNTNQTKDKVKRNKELERLDVTIIRMPDAPQKERLENCQKSHCTLGCICASLKGSYNLKQHCDRVDCIFECKCDFSKYKLTNSIEITSPELIPGILNLSNEINLKLAKEEQKFHQTVVMTGEKSILMRSERRNLKSSKKYADFYQSWSLKTDIKQQPVLSVVDIKLYLKNVEPWCMVHNLYKCFCKGKFTETSVVLATLDTSENEELNTSQDKVTDTGVKESDSDLPSLCNYSRPSRIKRSRNESNSSDLINLELYSTVCARTRPYRGRKYYDSYYINTNKKIEELEKNDQSLYKKMMTLINKSEDVSKNLKNLENKDTNNGTELNIVHHHDHDTIDLSEHESLSENNESTCSSTNMAYFNKHDNTEVNRQLTSMCEDNSNSLQFLSDNVFSEMISSEFTLSEEITENQTIVERKRLPNETKLVAWLESSYKQYKQRLDKGIVKTALEPPKEGKIALYPWEFILSRYRERKNLFLISKQRPFRIFMAVDMKNMLFKNCINIDDIRFADLHKYPITVKNLLTNATDLKDIFFILSGLAFCWELIGSVTKINERKESESKENELYTADSNTKLSLESEFMSLPSESKINPESTLVPMELDNQVPVICNDKESSKWFVMTIENDFSEIKFYKRGFFVKYESIIKAINVARMTGKTVRLSSQKTADRNDGPQFGIYAIPNVYEYCVFVGPYDKDEFLDLETVKSISDVGKTKNTRGVWITTKKIDNLKVIDNPLSFMPNLHPNKILTLESEAIPKASNKNSSGSSDDVVPDLPEIESSKLSQKKQKLEPKLVKPIRIRKTNGFYHLKPRSFLKQNIPHKVSIQSIPQHVLQQGFMQCSNQNQCVISNDTVTTTNRSLLQNISSTFCETWPYRTPFTDENNKVTKKPVAEIAPQIKIVDVYSEATTTKSNKRQEPNILKREKGMFILKPEEINKKLMDGQKNPGETSQPLFSSHTKMNDDDDIENFLATSKICTAPSRDNLIIFNNEETARKSSIVKTKQLIFIACKNVENLGWIRGKRNHEDKISFEFPGFQYTLFYEKEEAFSKINQVLSRKVYVPKNIRLEWQVVESEEKLKTKTMLTANHLGKDFVLTKQGLRHKRDLMANAQVLSIRDLGSRSSDNGSTIFDHVDKASDFYNELEEQNKKLEEESNQLLTKMKERGLTPTAQRTSVNEAK